MEISASVHWVFQILGEALGFLSIKDSLLEGLIAYNKVHVRLLVHREPHSTERSSILSERERRSNSHG